ncbi:MAG: hypothetical protein JSU87_15175 [Gemmatimonadota bacterium]|nr:MAG: hypothetical protein JSU87_15175 [Gemmatimonadota bacterium]
MKNWTSEGHLTELALELWAAREAEDHELQAFESHIQQCRACKAQTAEWRGLMLALASLRGTEPSESFAEHVMERVRLPVPAAARTGAWMPSLALRRIAAAAAALWSAGVIGGAVWLGSRVDFPAGALLTRLAGYASDFLLAAVIRIAALLHLSSLGAIWLELQRSVPGLALAAGLALMTIMSGAAIWTLHRVTTYQPSRANAHG